MDLIIKNRIIRTPMYDILQKLKQACKYDYFNYIGKQKGNDIKITCPWHKNGMESHPSCHVFCDYNDPKIYYGTVHCFTCGKQVPLYTMVGYCLDGDDDLGKEWLVNNFGDTFLDEGLLLEEISFEKKNKPKYLDPSILEQYNYYHPYMTYRNLSNEVISCFKIGYDKNEDAITFPVWDINNNLLFITKRKVTSKMYILPEDIEKPVYLLNFVVGKNYPFVVVCEGQIDALVSWSYGIPAVSLFGAATTPYQINQLKKSGIINYVLMYDNDTAGRHGASRFKQMINKDSLVTDIIMPVGKDVGACTKEEFFEILRKNDVLS